MKLRLLFTLCIFTLLISEIFMHFKAHTACKLIPTVCSNIPHSQPPQSFHQHQINSQLQARTPTSYFFMIYICGNTIVRLTSVVTTATLLIFFNIAVTNALLSVSFDRTRFIVTAREFIGRGLCVRKTQFLVQVYFSVQSVI